MPLSGMSLTPPDGTLGRLIATDIVPRLLLSHRVGPISPAKVAEAARGLREEEVDEFVRIVRQGSDAEATGFVDALIDNGITSESVYLDLLAPAARKLGTMWEKDQCDFVEVTVALGRLQRSLRSLSRVFLEDTDVEATAGRILLTCLPGEQHTLGLFMVAEFFVRSGWAVNVGPPLSRTDLTASVRDEWYDVIGFSVSCDSSLRSARRVIDRVRAESRNDRVRVMLGGRILNERPELAEKLGADGWASDAREAPKVAAALT